eukprot:scaffold465495_cov51-Prasinocladus_malaysianus.AAC.1
MLLLGVRRPTRQYLSIKERQVQIALRNFAAYHGVAANVNFMTESKGNTIFRFIRDLTAQGSGTFTNAKVSE